MWHIRYTGWSQGRTDVRVARIARAAGKGNALQMFWALRKGGTAAAMPATRAVATGIYRKT